MAFRSNRGTAKIVKHRVANFDQWKGVFDSMERCAWSTAGKYGLLRRFLARLALNAKLTNVARLAWWPGPGDANPADDWDFAGAQVPGAHCLPPEGEETNLKIEKVGDDICEDFGHLWRCGYSVVVTNTGPGVYSDDIVVTDTLSVANPIWPPMGDWACVSAPPVHTCTLPAASLPDGPGGGQLNPGNFVLLVIYVDVPKGELVEAGKCWVDMARHGERTVEARYGGVFPF